MYDRNHQRFIKVFNCESEYSEKMDLCKLYSFCLFTRHVLCVCIWKSICTHRIYNKIFVKVETERKKLFKNMMHQCIYLFLFLSIQT